MVGISSSPPVAMYLAVDSSANVKLTFKSAGASGTPSTSVRSLGSTHRYASTWVMADGQELGVAV